jgi:hypothetical protein
MPDEIKSNLEPIDESDLDLKDKFLGGKSVIEKGGIQEEVPQEKAPVHFIEENAERKEGAAEKEASYSKILSKVGSATYATSPEEEVKNDAEITNNATDAESKLTNLVNLAEMKGIPHAVKVARHLEDNYTLDEFHDRLLGDQLHDALVKKGMIKEI